METRPELGSISPSSSSATVLFPAPLSPTSATVSPGASSRSSPSSTSPERVGYENDTCSSRTGARAGLGASRASAGATGSGASSNANIRSATASPSALAWYSAPSRRNGRYSSGASTSTVSPAWSARLPFTRAHPRGHGDQCDPERRRQLQHRPRQKAHPERLHGRDAVALADLAEHGHLIVGSSKGAQRRQASDHVEKMRREAPQSPPARLGPVLGVAADQRHEHGHQGQREQHDQRRLEVHDRHPDEHQKRDDRGEHDLRQVAREVALQRLDPLHRDGGDLGAFRAVDCRRLRAQSLLDERQAELGQHAPGGSASGHLHAPRECAPSEERDQEQADVHPEGVKRRAVKRPRDDQREQAGLEQHRQRHADAQHRVDREQRPRRPRSSQQPRVESAHGT